MRQIKILNKKYESMGLDIALSAFNGKTLRQVFWGETIIKNPDFKIDSNGDGLADEWAKVNGSNNALYVDGVQRLEYRNASSEKNWLVLSQQRSLTNNKKYYVAADISVNLINETGNFELWFYSTTTTFTMLRVSAILKGIFSGFVSNVFTYTGATGNNNLWFGIRNSNNLVSELSRVDYREVYLIDVSSYELTKEQLDYYYKLFLFLKYKKSLANHTYLPEGSTMDNIAYVNKTIDEIAFNGYSYREIFEPTDKSKSVNIVKFQPQTITKNGITITVNADYSITINGTVTGATNHIFPEYYEPNITRTIAFRYISGTTSGHGFYFANTPGWNLSISRTSNFAENTQTTATPTQEYRLYLDFATVGMVYNNFRFYIQLEDGPSISYIKRPGEKFRGKNFLHRESSVLRSQTVNGVTISFLEDNSILLNGTASAALGFNFLGKTFPLFGNYVYSYEYISGVLGGGTFSTQMYVAALGLDAMNIVKTTANYAANVSQTHNCAFTAIANIYIPSGTVFSSLRIRLQLEPGTIKTFYQLPVFIHPFDLAENQSNALQEIYTMRRFILKQNLTYADVFYTYCSVKNYDLLFDLDNNDIADNFSVTSNLYVKHMYDVQEFQTTASGGRLQSIGQVVHGKKYILYARARSTSFIELSQSGIGQVLVNNGNQDVWQDIYTEYRWNASTGGWALHVNSRTIMDYPIFVDGIMHFDRELFDENFSSNNLITLYNNQKSLVKTVVYPQLYLSTEPTGLGNRYAFNDLNKKIYGHELNFENMNINLVFGLYWNAYDGFNQLMKFMSNNEAIIEYNYSKGERYTDVRLVNAPKTEMEQGNIIRSKFDFKRLTPFYTIVEGASLVVTNDHDWDLKMIVEGTVNTNTVFIEAENLESGPSQVVKFNFTPVTKPFNFYYNSETKQILINGVNNGYQYIDHSAGISFISVPKGEQHSLFTTGITNPKIKVKKWVID